MRSPSLPLLALSLLALGATTAADVHTFTFALSGAQEVPPVSPAGSGTCTVVLDDVTRQITVSGSYSGMTSPVFAAHIHAGAIGANGGVVVGLGHTGGTAGTLSGSATLSAARVATMLAGGHYVNVHTGNNTGGEIRGQVRCDANLTSSAVARNGSGANFAGFTSLSAPIIGTTWTSSVDTSAHPGALATIVAIATGGPTQVTIGFGELLGLPPFTLDVAAGSHALPIPDDCGLVGVSVVAQAATFALGGDVRLQNALDLTFGTN